MSLYKHEKFWYHKGMPDIESYSIAKTKDGRYHLIDHQHDEDNPHHGSWFISKFTASSILRSEDLVAFAFKGKLKDGGRDEINPEDIVCWIYTADCIEATDVSQLT